LGRSVVLPVPDAPPAIIFLAHFFGFRSSLLPEAARYGADRGADFLSCDDVMIRACSVVHNGANRSSASHSLFYVDQSPCAFIVSS